MFVGLLLLASTIFLKGIAWGLPSRSADAFLFGNRAPWTGKEILSLAPEWGDDAHRAADVAAHPLANRDQPIVLNQTDAQRAAIVRRYRLYSDQPDEMITLRALSQMKPGRLQLDPKLYQYGGLWVYPIGGLLKLASIFHTVRLTPDLAFYLDHPNAFGRLYLVMRLYSVLWGLIGLAVMFMLARKISRSDLIATITALCYTLLPTVINGAHEAKPHLAGAVLALFALNCALRAIESKSARWSIAAGVACGAAASMVISGWLSIGLLPVMAFLMPSRRLAVATAASAAMVCTYSVCNPYVIIHLLGDRAVLQSNLENSAAMYQTPASVNGIVHGVQLLFESGSTVIFFGLGVTVFLAWRRQRIACLLLAAAVPALCVFFLHAAGKPGEYARFALPCDLLFVFGTALAMGTMKQTIERLVMGSVLVLMLLPMGVSYAMCYGRPTRLAAAEELRQRSATGATTLAIDAEPAPYALPPVDLFQWKIVLLPRGASMPADADVRIDPVDIAGIDRGSVHFLGRPFLLPTPISWAGKPFRIETPSSAAVAASAPR